MAWRIDEHVVRGTIDNRTRGRVVGKIWFAGRAEPVELDLTGDCWRDLAGRRLEFENPAPKPGPEGNFAARQIGLVGDITASRKVKVLDFPLEDLHLYYKTGREMPWHWGNSLHLEWFSERNGRVVIESASYKLKIVGEPAWEMTEAEEEAQRHANNVAMSEFTEKLGETATGANPGEFVDDTPPEWNEVSGDEHDFAEGEDEGDESPAWEAKPETEAEAEARQAQSDLLADRIAARLKREGEAADYEAILEEELDRLRRERGEPEPTAEELARNAEWIAEMNATADGLLADADSGEETEAEEDLAYAHPLVERASVLAEQLEIMAEVERWIPEGARPEHPLAELLNVTMGANLTLAGVLNGRDWPPARRYCAAAIVRLKKAREYLDDALRAMESCQEEKLLPPAQLGPMLVEVVDLARDVDELITELRVRLERGVE